MYEIECLTNDELEIVSEADACKPFLGECYPVAE